MFSIEPLKVSFNYEGYFYTLTLLDMGGGAETAPPLKSAQNA